MGIPTATLMDRTDGNDGVVSPREAAGFVFDIVCCECEIVYAYMKGPGAGGVTHGFCPACYESKHYEMLALWMENPGWF